MRVGAIGCERSGFPALLSLGREEPQLFEESFEVFSIPCLGVVNEEVLLELLSVYDTLLLVGCPLGSCFNEWGSTLAEKKVKRVNSLLQEAEIAKEVLLVFATVQRTGELRQILRARVLS